MERCGRGVSRAARREKRERVRLVGS